jgi:hypothetical protein
MLNIKLGLIVPHVTKNLALKINTISIACNVLNYSTFHDLKPSRMEDEDFLKDYIKINLKQYKMLPHENTSFVANVDQINHMLFAKENI